MLQPIFLSFPLLFLVTSPLHPFVLSLPPCPVFTMDYCILSGLPLLLSPKQNTNHMLFSVLHNYNRSCTIISYSSFSLYARCCILQPLSFPRQIAVSYCIPLATVSPILSFPYFYVPRSFALCTCGTMNTGH